MLFLLLVYRTIFSKSFKVVFSLIVRWSAILKGVNKLYYVFCFSRSIVKRMPNDRVSMKLWVCYIYLYTYIYIYIYVCMYIVYDLFKQFNKTFFKRLNKMTINMVIKLSLYKCSYSIPFSSFFFFICLLFSCLHSSLSFFLLSSKLKT